MFISSMARKNKLKRSKSEEIVRKSSSHPRKRQGPIQNVEYSDSNKPPQSVVKKSNVIFVDGSGKKLQKSRDKPNLSNSAKTIRPYRRHSLPPNSNVEVASNPSDLPESNSIKNEKSNNGNLNTTGHSSGELSLSEDLEKKLMLGSYNSLANTRYKQTQSSFVDTPENSKWYLDPLHRRIPPYNDHSFLRSYDLDKDFDAEMFESNFSDNDYESELDLKYLVNSKSIEREALERAASITPYELELCRLRKEKLRLEESCLLKQKCELELERTRGPRPKWYELKTPQFTEEMEKYDNLMNNRKYWNELIDYRNHLLETSSQLPNFK